MYICMLEVSILPLFLRLFDLIYNCSDSVIFFVSVVFCMKDVLIHHVGQENKRLE
jgi:hypothetical protein